MGMKSTGAARGIDAGRSTGAPGLTARAGDDGAGLWAGDVWAGSVWAGASAVSAASPGASIDPGRSTGAAAGVDPGWSVGRER